MAEEYGFEEVANHNKAKDLWMIMNNSVYNLTDFLSQHPGGEEVLLALAGQDGTVCFNDVGHSQEAHQLRDLFKVGSVKGGGSASGAVASSTPKKTEPTVDDDDWVYEEPKKTTSPYIPLFVAIGVLVYAVLFIYVL